MAINYFPGGGNGYHARIIRGRGEPLAGFAAIEADMNNIKMY